MIHFVYILVDPRTDTPGYVGITNNPNQRMFEHLEGRVGKGRKYEWVNQLLALQVEPKMKILEVVESRQEARQREEYWIQEYLKQGIQLTNVQSVTVAKPSTNPRPRPKNETIPTPGLAQETGADIITAREAQLQLGIGPDKFHHWVKSGFIQKVEGGYYRRSDVNDIEERQRLFILAGSSKEAMKLYEERYGHKRKQSPR